ncbi:MAG: ABC transporter permease subunit [Robiginitomaculum sp.]
MFGKLLKFELKFHIKSVGFWITFAILFILGLVVMSVDSFTVGPMTGERIKANGSVILANQAAIFSISMIFFAAIFVVGGLMRDQTHKCVEIIHSTPVSSLNLIVSRMVGVFLATFLCVSAVQLGLFAGQFMPWMDKESLGSINLVYFLLPMLLFSAINALMVSSLFAFIAATTRSRALVYVSAVGMLVLYVGVLMFSGKTDSDLIVSLVDPLGIAALGSTTELWPAFEQNNRLMPIMGYVGMNRLLWGGVGLLLYALTAIFFVRGLSSRKVKSLSEDDETEQLPIKLVPVALDHSFGAKFRGFLTRTKFEYLTTVKSIPFAVLTLITVALFMIAILSNLVMGASSTLPTSTEMINTVLGSLGLPMMIIIVFFGGDFIWRDKAAGMMEIIDSTPVKNISLMAAKWVSMMAIVLSLLCVGIIVGMITQMLLGDIPVNISTYLKSAFISFAPGFMLYAALAMFIQNFMPNRVTGMIGAGVIMMFFLIGIRMLPFYHPLMGYGHVPAGRLSEMAGFISLTRFKWFGLYWGLFAALMAVASVWLWRRGTQSTLRARLKGLGQRLSVPSVGLASLLLAGFVGTGGYIYKAYNIDEEYLTSKQEEKQMVRWEKSYGALIKLDVPKIRSVEVDIDFTPSERILHVKGHYEIENTTGKPLTDLYIHIPSIEDEYIKGLSLEGAKRIKPKGEDGAETLEDFGTRLYRFSPPLELGSRIGLNFEFAFPKPKLGRGSPVTKNGTFVSNKKIMPTFGVADNRLHNPDKRRKYGLPEREKMPERTDRKARRFNFFDKASDYVNFKASVCTEKGQIPIAPGALIRTYDKDGKVCRSYQAVRPIANFFSFLSADYAVKDDVWKNPNGKNVPLEIYYHKTHDYNIDLMIEGMKDSLSTYTEVFGPYQYNQLRIMEFPYANFAQSFAGTIPFSENIGFVQEAGDPDDIKKTDLATFVTMHEIAHQWFGHQFMPARTKGFNVLSEGLTQNAAMTAYERKLGWKKARRLLQQNDIDGSEGSYLTGRIFDSDDEPPLAKAERQSYLTYAKASWVFWGLKQYMGEEKMQGAIRGFLEEYGSKGPLYPTTKELVEALRAAAPENMQGLITDYWDRIVFWELGLDDDVAIRENSSGGYRVSFTARVDKKIASEKTSKETSISEIDGEELSEWVEVGFYKEDPKDTLGGDWMALERVLITKGETKLSFDLEEKPAYVLLDPRRLLIEREVTDNAKKIK